MYRQLTKSFIQKRNLITIIEPYEKGIKTIFGQYSGIIEPGFILDIPFIHSIEPIDMRDKTISFGRNSYVSSDNVTFNIDTDLDIHPNDLNNMIIHVTSKKNDEKLENVFRDIFSTKSIDEIQKNRNNISNEILKKYNDLNNDTGITIKSIHLFGIFY